MSVYVLFTFSLIFDAIKEKKRKYREINKDLIKESDRKY